MENVTPDWEAQLIEYTLGVMEPGEAATFEDGLEECRQHVQLARDYRVVLGLLGTAAPSAEPPQGHKSRLVARLQATPQAQPATPTLSGLPTLPTPPTLAPMQAPLTVEPARVTDMEVYRARRSNTGLLAALSAVAAALILLVGLWGWNAQAQQISDLQKQLGTLALKPNIPPGYTALTLPPQPGTGSEGVSAAALYNPQKNDVIFVAGGLKTLPSDKVYELWLLKPQGNPEPAGVFTPDPSGSARHTANGARAMAQYAGFAVSEEPAPGVPAPTGPIIVAGQHSTP